MAGEYKKLPRKLYPKAPIKKESKEQLYWNSFQFPTIVKEFSSVNHVNYSPIHPYECLVTNAAKIQIFDIENNVKRSSSRPKENVYGGRYRSDGKLMVAGGDSGVVQVLDVNTRSILRNFEGHKEASRVCYFSEEPTKIFTASDDKSARYWDLPTGKQISHIKSHKDYVRCGCTNPTNNELFVTGSYDHMVKIWDTRSDSVSMTMDHGAPVECVLVHQSGSVCISSGGNYVKVWDLLGGGKLFTSFSFHQKTITTMCFDKQYKRLLSGGLDRYVKIYDVSDNYALVASINYPSPILAMDLAGDGNHLAVGMADGAISFRHRIKSKNNKISNGGSRKRHYPLKPGMYKYRTRNQSSRPDKEDVIIRETFAPKMSKTDRYLQKFRYREALDFALADIGSFPSYIISLLMELSRQNVLELVLSNRNADELKDIMLFLTRNITNPRYAKTLIPIANLIIDKYSHMVGQSKVFDASLKHLSRRISQDLQPYNDMMKLLGSLDYIFCMITPPPNMQEVYGDSHIKDNIPTDKVLPKNYEDDSKISKNKKDNKNENSVTENEKSEREQKKNLEEQINIDSDSNNEVDFNVSEESANNEIVIS